MKIAIKGGSPFSRLAIEVCVIANVWAFFDLIQDRNPYCYIQSLGHPMPFFVWKVNESTLQKTNMAKYMENHHV